MKLGLSLGICAAAGSTWIPSRTSGNVLTLESDLGVTTATGVSQWNDQSSVASVLAQGTAANQPTYAASDANFGGKPSLYFDGTNDALLTAGTASTSLNCLHNGLGVTVIALIRPDTGTISNRGQIVGTYNTSTAQDIGGGLRYEPDQSDLNFVGGNGSAVSINGRSGASFPPATTMLVRAWHATSLNPDQDFFINGTQGGAGSSRDYLASPTTNNTAGKLAVGATPALATFYKGYLAAVWVWNRLLDAGELTAHKNYVNTKYAQSFAGA